MKASADMLDRMEALVRRLASVKSEFISNGCDATEDASILVEARAIVSELPEPVDPDVTTAREIIALAMQEGDGLPPDPNIANGTWDESPQMVALVAALRRAREEGVR